MFVKYKMAGFEPAKVAALNKQSGGLFVASESLSGSESQIVCKAQCAAADGESLMVHHQKAGPYGPAIFILLCLMFQSTLFSEIYDIFMSYKNNL